MSNAAFVTLVVVLILKKLKKKTKTFRMLLVNFQFNGSNMSDRVEMWLIKGL